MNKTSLVPPAVCMALAVSLWVPSTLFGQVLPGQPRPQDRLQVQQAQFRALILDKVNSVVSEWQEAWNGDSPEELARTYAEFGILALAGETLKGREEIEEFYRGILPSYGHLSFSLSEFEASGSMAMMLSTFFFRETVGSNEWIELVGDCLTVFMEEHGNWKIRSQFFRTVAPN